MANGSYSRVYHSLMTEYPEVWASPAQLGVFVKLLVIAEKFWPQEPPIPRSNSAVRALIGNGLITVSATNTYRIRGLEAERERRSHAGRNAAASRWGMPRRDEKRKEEHGDANASRTSSGNGRFNGYEAAPGEALVPRHEGQHPDCLVCEPMREAASA